MWLVDIIFNILKFTEYFIILLERVLQTLSNWLILLPLWVLYLLRSQFCAHITDSGALPFCNVL